MAGAALIAIFGSIAEPAHNLNQLLSLLGRWQFILWVALTLVMVILTWIAARFLKYLASRPVQKPNPKKMSRPRLLRGMCYGFMSGILSAHTLLVAKSAVELIVRTVVDRVNQFNRFESWLILLALIFLALTQLYYLHRGLKLCSTSVLYPFVFCIYNIIAILDGLIYFHQTSQLTPLDAVLIALGTVVLLAGVLALSWRLNEGDVTDTLPPPHTPLTAGMSFVEERPRSSSSLAFRRQSEDEQSQARRPSRLSISERSPLLAHAYTNSAMRRPSRKASAFAPINTERAEIWASLADEPSPEEEKDVLSSLPKSPLMSPYISHHKRRRSRASTHSQPSSTSRPNGRHDAAGASSSGDEEDSPHGAHHHQNLPRRSVTWSTRQYARDRRRRSAPHLLSPDRGTAQSPTARAGSVGSGGRRRSSGAGDERPGSASRFENWRGWLMGASKKEDDAERDGRGGDG